MNLFMKVNYPYNQKKYLFFKCYSLLCYALLFCIHHLLSFGS